MNKITVFEHSTLRVGTTYNGVAFSKWHFNRLVQWNEKQGRKFLAPGYESLSFKNYVGVIQVKNTTIEILPKADRPTAAREPTSDEKLWRDALLYMLSVVAHLNIYSSTPSFLKTKNTSLLDFFIRLFIKEVHDIIHKGLVKKYRQVERNSTFVKGKILFSENIKRNLLHEERCFVRMTTYDYQNLYNAILKTAIDILRKTYSLQKSTSDELDNLYLYLENVKPISAKSIKWHHLSYNRKNNHYKKALDLARLIIENSNPEIQAGKNEILAFLFDMNKLFEDFVARQCLRASKEMTDVEVRIQNSKPFWQSQTIRPDLVFQMGSENRIADTKWKLPDNQPSSEDLKQMYVYNIYWQSRMAFLIYPSQTGEQKITADDVPFKETKQLKNFPHGVAMLPIHLFKKNELNREIGKDIITEIEKKEAVQKVN